MAEETVKVSLVQGMNYRALKTDPYIKYKPGINEMPISHARGLGILNRIVRVSSDGAVVKGLPFEGTFDEKLTASLEKAGFKTLEDLKKASRDEILAVPGVGPMAFERINEVLGGGE